MRFITGDGNTARRAKLAAGAVLALLLAGTATTGLAAEAHDSESGHGGRNEIALFIGSTQSEEHEGDRDDPQFTLGVDYERILTDHFGVGLLADFVFEGHREVLLGVPLFLHAPHGLTFQYAPGWHKVKDSGESGGVLRLGLLWGFDVKRIRLVPAVFYDIAKEDNLWVLGLNIAKVW